MKHGLLRGRIVALMIATALLAIGATTGTASAATGTFTNSSTISINDDAPATPYPSSINVTGFAGNVQKATVTLHGFSHTYADDVAVLLVGPSGANSILMGRVGGTSDTGIITLTFDQAASAVLNDVDTATSGTYRPSQSAATPTNPLSSPAPGGPYPVDLNTFVGKPANGTWNLFIEDQAAADFGAVLGGWSLTLNAPVNTVIAGKPKLNKKKGTAQIPVTVGDAGTLLLTGKGVKTRSLAVGGPGTTTLGVKPKGKTAHKLNDAGKAAAKVNITFTPNGGAAGVAVKKVKLKKRLG
jgi:subtilisin-like proprotein convertase family protein